MLSGTSDCAAVGAGGATAADFLDVFFVLFLAAFFVVFFAAFFVDLLALTAFFVPLPAFFDDFLADFFADFFAAFTAFFAPPRDFDFDALFLVPLPAPLRAPLDFLVPFLAAIAFTPFEFLSLAQRNKII
jgi:hypothetical protein